MNYSDFGTDIFVSENCNTCGRVVLRIPHELFVDMLKNCPRSYNRDVLIRKLKDIPKSLNLEAAIEREKIFEMLEE